MTRALAIVAAAALSHIAAGQPAQAPAAPTPKAPAASTAVTPAPRTDAGWVARNKAMNERAAKGDADLVFIGDSITQGWEGEGRAVWAKRYAPRKAVNLGIGGDRTQHVLWRLDHGNLDGIKPKVAVVMIGTNNSNGNDHTAEEIAAGVKAIVARVREKTPDTKVLLLAVFPRGEGPGPQREKLAKVNELIKPLDDGKVVRYLDIGPKFMDSQGNIPGEVMPDHLHLSAKGYEIWGEAMEPLLAEMLGEEKK